MSLRRRRGASSLYQVDFIAALFSGFLLIWLATAAESDATTDSASPVFYVLQAKLYYGPTKDEHDPTRLVWVSGLPDEALKDGCAPPELISYVAKRGNLVSCNYAEKVPRGPEGETRGLMGTVAYRAKQAQIALDHNVIPAFGLALRLVDDGPGDDGGYPTVGLAVSEISASDRESYFWARDKSVEADLRHEHVSVGLVPSKRRIPTAIEVGSAEVTAALYGIFGLPSDELDNSKTKNGSRAYTFGNLHGLAAGQFRERVKLEVKLLLDPGGSEQCWLALARGQLMQGQQRLKFERAPC